MSDDDLSNIEQKLGVTLPPAYRRLMLVRGAVLRASEVDHLLWASADRVVQSNLGERDPRGGTAGAYPQWWETYLLIGDNGDCEFFCLRLDGDAAVYKIGSDDGGPERVAKSLAGYQRTKCVRERLHPVPEGAKVACPCCGHLTLCRPKNWEECPVCLWHDDGRRPC